MAHEIGHLVRGSILNEEQAGVALLEGTFAEHLEQESELFADCLVSLMAYDRSVVRNIGIRYEACLLKPNSVTDAARYGYAEICPEFRIDIFSTRLSAEWRLRYLTSLVHYLKLRCALFHTAGI
jgi:Zn-dependent protease with chaperone function